jgi:Cysteine rich repeat
VSACRCQVEVSKPLEGRATGARRVEQPCNARPTVAEPVILPDGQTAEQYLVAVPSSMVATPPIISSELPVIAIGGFAGRAQILNPVELRRIIKTIARMEASQYAVNDWCECRASQSIQLYGDWSGSHHKRAPRREMQDAAMAFKNCSIAGASCFRRHCEATDNERAGRSMAGTQGGCMRVALCMVTLAATVFALPALAQTTQPTTGKGALRGACSAEAQKFCANTPRGKGQLRSCLQEHQAELSDSCKAAMSAQPNG